MNQVNVNRLSFISSTSNINANNQTSCTSTLVFVEMRLTNVVKIKGYILSIVSLYTLEDNGKPTGRIPINI